MATFVLLILSLFSTSIVAEIITGRVVSVTDGDTVIVLDAAKTQHKIRLEGIDAPERGQDYGAKATEALKQALGAGLVAVTVTNKDRYGRSIGRIMVGEVNVNAWMVQHGWAWHYKAYSKDSNLAKLEVNARAAKVGLWADPNPPQAPWDFRAAKRGSAKTPKKPIKAGSGQFWLNTGSGVRHNQSCRYFRLTSKGRLCGKDEGRACGNCGG